MAKVLFSFCLIGGFVLTALSQTGLIERYLTYFPSEVAFEQEQKKYTPSRQIGAINCLDVEGHEVAYVDCIKCVNLRMQCPDCCFEPGEGCSLFAELDDPDWAEFTPSEFGCDFLTFFASADEFKDFPECENMKQEMELPDFCEKFNHEPRLDAQGCLEQCCPDFFQPAPDDSCERAWEHSHGFDGWLCFSDNHDLTNYPGGCEFSQEVVDQVWEQINSGIPCEPSNPVLRLNCHWAQLMGYHPDYQARGWDINNFYEIIPHFDGRFQYRYRGDCLEHARSQEDCIKGYCCQEFRCEGQICDRSPGGLCDQRTEFEGQVAAIETLDGPKACALVNLIDCVKLQQEIDDALSDKTKPAFHCFQEVDPEFAYQFIPKSGESFTVFWSLGAEPVQLVEDTYFYTRIQVYEENSFEPVYVSIRHQKEFENVFSIFNVTHIGPGELNSGRKHRMKAYYYIPASIGPQAAMDISDISLIVVRVRE